MPVRFFEEETTFKLVQKNRYKNWIKQIAKNEGYSMGELNYIFCSDEYLLQINVAYLDHDTFTDIITFDQRDDPKEISGEIYISVDRVSENALLFKVPFQTELERVISHGLLHLCGYSDKNKEEKLHMRLKEDEALRVLNTLKS
nr:rRNA maturation RNase YbeY [Cytophagales bacterium]